MIFLELALQGIQGFAPLTRISFKTGINVGRNPDSYPRRAVLDAIYHALYPDPARAQATERLADRAQKESRIALTFFGRDKETYRVVREAVNGAVSLHKFDKETKKYSALTRTAVEVTQYLRVNQQLPDEVAFERLFVFSPESMPSKGQRARTRSGSGIAKGSDLPSGPGRPAARGASGIRMPPQHMSSALSAAATATSLAARSASVAGFGSALNQTNALVQAELNASEGPTIEAVAIEDSADDLDAKREQLNKMKAEMMNASRAERAQMEIDALNAHKFELAQKAERSKELRDEVTKLKRIADSQSELQDLPSGFGERLKRFEEMQVKFQSDRQKLGDERLEVEKKVQETYVLRLQEDRYFLASVLFGLMFVTAGITFEKSAIALLNIPCMTIAAAAAFRWVAELEKKARVELKLTTVADRELRLERQYDLDTAALRRLMEKLDIHDPRDLLERIEGAEQVQKQLRAAEQELAAFRSDPQSLQAERELEQVTKRLEALEAEVMGAAGIISASTLDRRIAALEKEIAVIEAKRGIAPQAKIAPRAASPSPQFPAPEMPQARASTDLPRVITGDLVRAGSGVFTPYDPSSLSSITAAQDPTKKPAPMPRSVSIVVPPNPDAASLFDFGGGNIGGGEDEDDDGQGYGGGYRGGGGGQGGGSPRGGGGSGASRAGHNDGGSDEGLFAAPSGFPGGGGGGASSYDSEELPPDRSRDLMHAAVDILQISVDALSDKMERRLKQYLDAFTEGRLEKVEFGARGELSVFEKGASDSIAYVDLAGQDLDLVDSALRFTLIEACLGKVRVPLLIDDPFGGFNTKRRVLLSQMLGYLGKATQVVFMTEKDDVAGNVLDLSVA